jgi:hypothetical protein
MHMPALILVCMLPALQTLDVFRTVEALHASTAAEVQAFITGAGTTLKFTLPRVSHGRRLLQRVRCMQLQTTAIDTVADCQ